MIGAAYHTVEDIEVLWTLISLFGLCFSVFNLKEARKDKVAISSITPANGRARIASAILRSEIARVVKQAIFLIIGIMVMTLPGQADSLDQGFRMLFIGIVVRWGLITASALTTYQAYLAFRLRRDLLYDDAH